MVAKKLCIRCFLNPGTGTTGLCVKGGCNSYYHQKKKEIPSLTPEDFVRNYPSRKSGKARSMPRMQEMETLADIESPVAELVPGFVVHGDEMLRLCDQLKRVAPRDTSVLITGESGVGKEYIARAIHDGSGRRSYPYVIIDCATLSEELVESDLFGHARGAYTGATKTEAGLLSEAHLGTVFLDEISTLSMKLQTKLLRFLETGTYRKLGGKRYEQVNTRIVAATNVSLREMVACGEFREDLFYRLNVFGLTVPPLRKRRDTIPVLAQYIARRMGHSDVRFSDRVIDFFSKYTWPGNVRELKNVIEHALVMCDHGIITTHDLPDEFVLEA